MVIKLKRKKELPTDMCAAKGCRRKTGLKEYEHPEKGHIVLCDSDKHEHDLPEYAPDDTLASVFEDEEAPEVVAEAEVPTTAIDATGKVTEATLKAEANDAGEALDLIHDLVISSPEEVEFAAELLADAKGHWKRLDNMKREATRPMNDALKAIRSWFKPAQNFYKDAEAVIKEKLATYHNEQDAAKRLALATAQQAFEEGDHDEVSVALAGLEETEEPEVSGLSYRKVWKFRIDDVDQIPRAFMSPNETKIGVYVMRERENAEIPGVTVYEDTVVASKSN